MSFSEVDISEAIIRGYHKKLLDGLASDVIIVGADRPPQMSATARSVGAKMQAPLTR